MYFKIGVFSISNKLKIQIHYFLLHQRFCQKLNYAGIVKFLKIKIKLSQTEK